MLAMSLENHVLPARWPQTPFSNSLVPVLYDVDLYRKSFEQQSDRLFVSPEKVRLKVLSSKQGDVKFSDAASFEAHLAAGQCRTDGLHIVMVPQVYSWGKLMISQNAMETMLESIEAIPPVLDMIEAFGERSSPSNEGLGGIRTCEKVENLESSLSDVCFLIKHLEEHGREESGDRWSIRQMGVYIRNVRPECTTIILLNPSQSLRRRLNSLRHANGGTIDLSSILLLLASCATQNWQTKIGELEEDLLSLKSKAHDAAVFSGRPQRNAVRIDFADSQDFKIILDKLLSLDHILETNTKVIRHLLEPTNESTGLAAPPGSALHVGLKVCIAEQEAQRRRVLSLQKRFSSSSELVQNIIAAQGLFELQDNGRRTERIMQLAQKDNKAMIKLSRDAQKDARTLKTITVLTMIYLPVAFVSQVLAMGYIRVARHNSGFSLQFSGELIIFAVLSIVLLLVTGGSWAVLEWRTQMRDRLLEDSEAAAAQTGKDQTIGSEKV